MKTTLSLGLVIAAASTLFACSDEGTERPTGGGGTQTGTNGGSSGSTAQGGSSGSGQGGSTAGQGGGGSEGPPTGPALTISEDATVLDTAGDSGINGAAIFVKSMLNPDVTLAPADGRLCFSGATAQVVNMDYNNYWGAGVYVDLNRGANPNAPADAGADAGDGGVVLGTVAQPWDPADGNVVGFQFVLEGQDPALGMEAGVPPEMRLQARPTGVSEDQSACKNLPATGKHNVPQNVLFDEMFFECYNATPGRGLWGDPLPAEGTRELLNIGFQVNASTMIAYPFNFCIKDIKPILAN